MNDLNSVNILLSHFVFHLEKKTITFNPLLPNYPYMGNSLFWFIQLKPFLVTLASISTNEPCVLLILAARGRSLHFNTQQFTAKDIDGKTEKTLTIFKQACLPFQKHFLIIFLSKYVYLHVNLPVRQSGLILLFFYYAFC